MTAQQLLLESLVYHWRAHVAVLLCVAVGTTVVCGALLVGDSMRGSLSDITLDRLGRVDYAMRAGRFFRAALAAEVVGRDTLRAAQLAESQPAIALRGSVTRVDSAGRETDRAGRVQVWGVTQDFWAQGRRRGAFDPAYGHWNDGRFFRDAVVLSENLARELGVRTGDEVLARVELPTDIPREAVLGRKSETIRTIRLRVTDIASAGQMGRFGLEATQLEPRNAFIPLRTIQDAVGQPGRANAILVSEPPNSAENSDQFTARLQSRLAENVRLDDIGLRLRVDADRGYVSLESSRMVLEPAVAAAADEIARDQNLREAPTLSYLANSIGEYKPLLGYEQQIPYSIISTFPSDPNPPFGPFSVENGPQLSALGEDDILLNNWAAYDLDLVPGDRVRVTYYLPDPTKPFETGKAILRVRGIIRLRGAAADPGLVPEYAGITDAKNYADWDPPFPMDLKRVRPKDEEYWKKYRTTPKAFVSLATAERLWGSRFGKWTSVRFAPTPGYGSAGETQQGERGTGSQGEKATIANVASSPTVPLPPSGAVAASETLADLQARLNKELMLRLRPEQLGLTFQPVKAQGLEASRGGTDFGQLFLSFSFFLIVSAAILIALVFRLGVERRAKQVGLLLAVGFDRSRVSRLLIAEGLIVAGVGCVVGLAGSIGYAWLVMAGLRTWWLPAVGTSLLRLHVPLTTLGIGAFAGLALAAVAIVGSVRGLTRLPPRALMAGAVADQMGRPTGSTRRLRLSVVFGCVALAAAVGLVPAAVLATDSAVLFFLVGASLLISALSFLTAYLTGDGRRPVRGQGAMAVARLGARNAGRNRGRSVLTASLVACATFVIVAVGANRTDEPITAQGSHAASGGFSLVAETDVPLLHDLNSPSGRRELGIPDSASDSFTDVRVFPFRVKEGEDASCLNLYQPKRPRVLGAPPAMIARGGFRVQKSLAETAEEKGNPWRLLDKNLGEDVIPAIGDANSVRWILKLGLGRRLSITAEDGRDVEFQIVAMLDKSIFQSELVISEANFRKLFPSQTGYSYFLIEENAESRRGSPLVTSAVSGRRDSRPLTPGPSPREYAGRGEARSEGSPLPLPSPRLRGEGAGVRGRPTAESGNSPYGFGDDHSSLAALLEQHLGDFGFDATPVSQRLAEYHAVENTYLSTFQMLGGLGLVLGTLGLGAVLLRSVIERRGELALLLAVGFRPGSLVWMVLAETGFLLIVGLAAGAVSALVAVAPHLVSRAAELPWVSLAGTLGVVLVAGVASSAAAVLATLRTPLLPALRSE